VSLAGIQRRLDGSDAVLLEVVALPRELVTFAVASGHAMVARRTLTEERAHALARASSGAQPAALAALYDAVIRPVEAALTGARRIIVVADPLLEGVPFAALYDRGARRHLVERTAVAMASSASSLVRDDRPPRASFVVAIGLPTGAETAGLPESEREVQEVARLYDQAVSIAPRHATWSAFTRAISSAAVDVVHIAGHAERQQGAGDAALLFAGGSGSVLQRISWKSIGAAPAIGAEVVVLAARETLRRPDSANTRALTLAEAFAGAGARDVVGTLVPITDRDARELFGALHRSLVAGDDAVDALRHAQLQALRARVPGRVPAWSGVAVLTTRIPVRHLGRNDDGHA